MGIRTNNVKKSAAIALTPVKLLLGTTATSQTGKRTDAVTIKFPFQIVSVEAYALTVTATMALDVQIGTTTALSATITPVADTPTAGTLSATIANTQSKVSTGVLSLLYTSGGSGAATNGYVTVWIRPFGMEGDSLPIKE